MIQQVTYSEIPKTKNKKKHVMMQIDEILIREKNERKQQKSLMNQFKTSK